MSDTSPFTVDAAVQRWYGDCLGDGKEVAGSPLAYEPRSAWGCELCHAILVGTKDGDLYLAARGHVRRLHEFGDVSIQAVHGCLNPHCDAHVAGGRAVIGSSDGRVHFFESIHRTPSAHDVAADRRQRPGVMATRLLEGSDGRPWCFVATNTRTIQLVPLRPGATTASHALPRNVRSVLVLTGPTRIGRERRDPRRERRWLLVSTDGHVASARVTWRAHGASDDLTGSDPDQPVIGHLEVGHLRHAPTCIAADRHDGTVRSILYGSQRGLHVALVDKDGLAREHDLLRDCTIRYVRVLDIFGVPYVLATGAGGRMWTRRWEHPEDTSEGGWLSWPALPSDAMFADISRDDSADEFSAFATVLLRTHEVYRIPVFDIKATKTRLREAAELRDRAPENTTDAQRFAEITTSTKAIPFNRLKALVRRGGRRTLPAAIASLEKPPSRSYREALELSIDIVGSAVKQGHQEARLLGDQLHRCLLVLLRDMPVAGAGSPESTESADRERLERCALFLRKYFAMAHTFSEKRKNLDQLVTINRSRESADAFVYAARLHLQGFDVCWERPITSPVLALAPVPTDTSGEVRRVGLSYANGNVDLFKMESDDGQSYSLEEVVLSAKPPQDGLPDPFGNYSRILRAVSENGPAERWVAAFRQPLAKRLPEKLIVPRQWPGDEAQHVYSVFPLNQRLMLLGLRNLQTPLALFDITSGAIDLITATWGTARHAQSRFAGGERRVWSIASLDPEASLLAVGAEDGYLRIGRLEGKKFKLHHPGPGHAEFLGSAIRSLATWQEDDRRLLMAGTEQGELYCFEVEGSASSTHSEETSLKFRDMVRTPILSLFVMEVEPGNPQLCVLEESGRITMYDVSRHARFDGFLGRRTGHYIVADGATTAVPLGGGRVLVAGWRTQNQAGWLRVVTFRGADGVTFRSPPPAGDLDRAVAAVASSVGTLRIDRPEEAGLEVLASMPLDDAAVRKATIRARLERALAASDRAARLLELRDLALETYPNDREEMKVLIEALSERLRDGTTDAQLALFEEMYKLFIEPRRLGPAYGRSRLQATLTRRLLTVPTLRLWRQVKSRPKRPRLTESDLQNWVERHLQHAEAFVRVDTLRAMSEALFELLRIRKHDPKAFTDVFPGSTPVTSAAWLLEALARFLYSHPPTQRGSECDTGTWAAVSVLVNLVRLFPDSVMVICDHIAVRRVDPLVFGVLERRLTSVEDRPILQRLAHYLPWLERPPLERALKVCGPFRRSAQAGFEQVKKDLRMTALEPDAAYLEAYAECYHWLGRMARATTVDDLIELGKDVRKLKVPAAPKWAHRLWPERDRFMQFAEHWISGLLKRVTISKARGAEGIDRLARDLDEVHQQLTDMSADPPLFHPELGIVRLIVEQWRGILRPKLPRQGDRLGDYTLGDPLPGSTYAFEIVGEPHLLASLSVVGTRAHREAAIDVWKRIRRLSDKRWSRIVPIAKVIRHAKGPAMIMQRLAGQDLDTKWRALVGRKPSERAALARACVIDIAGALADLHEKEMYHGDIQPSNIVHVDDTNAFYLIDFERSANQTRLTASTSFLSRGSYVDEERFGERQRGILALQQRDCMALASLCVRLVSGQKPRAEFKGALDIDGFDLHLRPWLAALGRRWDHSDEVGWSAHELREEASTFGRGVFVAGVTKDTLPIRERLAANAAGLEDWSVQGSWTPDVTRSTVYQLYDLINKARAVVFLLGPSAGEPARDVPEYIAAAAKKLGFRVPTYTVCEFLIARELNKPTVYFDVPPSSGFAQIRKIIDRPPLTTISESDCVEKVLPALREVLLS